MRKNKSLLPVTLFFVFLNTFFIAGKNILARWNADQGVLIIGNVLLFLITIASFLIAQRGLKNKNPHAFVRSVYSSVLLKLFICAAVAFAYIIIFKKELNKPALFACMGLYLVYTFLEVSILTKMLRGNAHA